MEKYQIVQILGEGSYGTVFLIRDQKGKQYALKKVQVDPFQVEQALKEIEVTTNFMHPNLIRIYESYYCDNTQKLQILMQYCQRGDLLNHFIKKQKQLSVDQIITIFRQIVKAFLAMNAKGVIHRDLKPQNVLIKQDGTIKIADFGCATSINPNQLSKIQKMSYEKGTPIYCSPQQLQNQEYSAKCDVWSAGCLLFFIYYKYHPFIDSSIQGSLQKIKRLTQNKKVQLKEQTDPTIGKIINLSLIYKDQERASWRQLWLSRLFSKKVKDVKNYLTYLRSVSNIANWMTKQFWKHRKQMDIGKNKNQLFAYFTIKFQHTNNQMALKIINKDPQFKYLFDSQAYEQFDPNQSKNKQIVKQLQQDSQPTYKYFQSIKQHMTTKQVYKYVKQKQLDRTSCFIDLDNSIKTAFRILQDILPQFSTSSSQLSQDSIGTKDTKESSCGAKCQLVWLIMARWINFQFWFSYQKNPRVQDILNQSSISRTGLMNSIDHQIQKYNYGVVQ